jgi:hypothetical protein
MMVNRVHPQTGKAWNTFRDRYRIRGACRAIDQQRGYVATRGKNPEKNLELTNGEYHQLKEDGLKKMPLKAKTEFYELDKAFDGAGGWADLRAGLSELGMAVERKGRGGVLKDLRSGQTIKLSRIDSSIGRNQSLGRLEKRFGKRKEFEQVLEAHKGLPQHLPDREVRDSFKKLSQAPFGSKAFRKEAEAGFSAALSQGRGFASKAGKAAKGLKFLAEGGNPLSGAAKIGLKAANHVIKGAVQASHQQCTPGLGLSR